ncbi:MAG: PEP/pyruvate-binding domain-containing protein [Desulfuromonas thiophila]|nr:PEP/pyruvate-binding domain-containing protein [Desulfuromonas thiophila]
MPTAARASSGYDDLDQILDGLRIGDNVVWEVDSMADYRYFVAPFVARARAEGRPLVYLRFGDHPPLLEEGSGVRQYVLDPREGFEFFASRIHEILTEEGRGVFYVFDCLSDLLSAWTTDYMVGNFFWVTCPYLFELDTVAYFALIRHRHSFSTVERIRKTTQVLISVFNAEERFYVQPRKVWQRYSATMFLPHRKEGERFVPLTNSCEATRLFSSLVRRGTHSDRHLDHWHHLFLQAEKLEREGAAADEKLAMVRHICRHMIGREPRILQLAERYLSLADLLRIKARAIGTGFIGGKAVGMLLANRILLADDAFDWQKVLEPHDSFYVGSNVYYSYIVHNGWWKLFMRQKNNAEYFRAGAELQGCMLEGSFPEPIRDSFRRMLEYYGQYPIIVRSSSLLEDGFGNAFAGKYDSFFCANQGSPEERLEQFEQAVRRIYASAMSTEALAYRLQRGLEQRDEQMALLIQRVSGSYHQQFYFPDFAGVGVSYNSFVWDKGMEPEAGMLRLVLGLGTRAVDRVDGDYPCIVALDAPMKRPHKGVADVRKFSQRDVDVLDVEQNDLQTLPLLRLSREAADLPWNLYAVRDHETSDLLRSRTLKKEDVWLLTFERLLTQTDFCALLQRALKTLEQAYDYPVDIEFTGNMDSHQNLQLALVQCRPLQTKGIQTLGPLPQNVADERILFSSEGNFMGGNVAHRLSWIVWVDPDEYARLGLSDKYEVARLVGRINRRIADRQDNKTLLLGPGRWGTSTPALGVPIAFNEISSVTVLGEVAFESEGLMPELSYGSHFFQDLVESEIFYLALYPERRGCHFNRAKLARYDNAFEGMMPASSRFKKVVKVYRVTDAGLYLRSDVVAQRLLCYEE